MQANNPELDPVLRHGHTLGPGCPVDCLKDLLPDRVVNRLARADGRGGAAVAPCGPPATVGDVVRLYRQGQLGEIAGLGRKSIQEIEACLLSQDLVAATEQGDVIGSSSPVDDLRAVLSGRVLNRLARADGRGGAAVAPCGPPATVGDVVRLYRQGRLGEIAGLGRRSIQEIEAALVLAGLDLTIGGPPLLAASRPTSRRSPSWPLPGSLGCST